MTENTTDAAAAPSAPAADATTQSEALQEAFADGMKAGHAATDFQSILDKWVAETVHNSPISRSTEAYSFLVGTAVPDLAARLAAG